MSGSGLEWDGWDGWDEPGAINAGSAENSTRQRDGFLGCGPIPNWIFEI